MSKSRNRALSLMVLVVFSLVIFSSSLFIIVHADHSCCGENCSVCIELAECHNALHPLGTAFAAALTLLLILLVVSELEGAVTGTHSKHTTLISLKVELLN